MQTMITELQDIYLFAWIDGGDLIAIEAKYYLKCLTTTSVWKIVMEELFAHEMQFLRTSLSDLSSSICLASDLLKSLKQPELYI